MYNGTHFLQKITGPSLQMWRVLGLEVWMDYLCSLRERGVFKDSGKTAKLNRKTEQLLHDNFHEDNFFLCSSHLWS